jgi:hypothetical protein
MRLMREQNTVATQRGINLPLAQKMARGIDYASFVILLLL